MVEEEEEELEEEEDDEDEDEDEEDDEVDDGAKRAGARRAARRGGKNASYVDRGSEVEDDEEDDEDEEEEDDDEDEEDALARRLQALEEDEAYDDEEEERPPVEDDADEWLPGAARPKKRRAPKAKKAKKPPKAKGSVTKPAGGGEKKKKPPRPRATGGRWTDSDSIKLKVAYDKSPSNWTLIAAQFDNRTPGACRDRYRTMYGEAKPEKHNGAPVGLAAPQGAIPKPRGRAPKLPDGSPAAWDPVKGEWIGVTNKAKPRASRAPKAAAPKRKAPPPAPYRSPVREVDLRAATFAGSYQDADDDDVAPLPKRQKIAVGDRVTLTLDPLEGVVTKTGSGWYTVKFEFGGVDNFRADELRVL